MSKHHRNRLIEGRPVTQRQKELDGHHCVRKKLAEKPSALGSIEDMRAFVANRRGKHVRTITVHTNLGPSRTVRVYRKGG